MADHDDDHEDNNNEEVEAVQRRMTNSIQNDGPTAIIKEGNLVKQGGNFKTWKKRWFTMTHDSIAYYDKQDGSVKGGILMESITEVRVASTKEALKHPFCFVIETKARRFVQHALNQEDMSSWMMAISKFSKIYAEATQSELNDTTPTPHTPSTENTTHTTHTTNSITSTLTSRASTSTSIPTADSSSRESANVTPVSDGFVLHYWPGIQGRTNAIRTMLEDAGATYTVKTDVMQFIYGDGPGSNPGFPSFAVPVLQHGDVVIGQTPAILQYLGLVLGYAPTSLPQQAQCLQVSLNCADLMIELVDTEAKDEEEQDKFFNERYPRWLSIFEKELVCSKNDPFFFGSAPKYCDFHLLMLLELTEFVFPGRSIMPTSIAVWRSKLRDRPRVKAYLSSKQRLPALPAALKGSVFTMSAMVEKIIQIKTSHPHNLTCKHFDIDSFNGLSKDDKHAFLQIVNSGIANADSSMGCYAMQPQDYDRFSSFFSKVLSEYHQIPEDKTHKNNWNLSSVAGLETNGCLDLSLLHLPPLYMRVRVARNFNSFSLPGAMNKEDRISMEAQTCVALDALRAMSAFGGVYHSLTPGHANHITTLEYKKLVDEHLMFKDLAVDKYLTAAGIASDWPFGRGCYISEDRNFVIWVGEEDHLRIMCMQKGTVLNAIFDRVKIALDVIKNIDGLEFAMSSKFGVITSCPTNVGTAMRASVHIPLPNSTRDGTNSTPTLICKPLGLSVCGTGGDPAIIGGDGMCEISAKARFCITEAEIMATLYNGLKLLQEDEQRASS